MRRLLELAFGGLVWTLWAVIAVLWLALALEFVALARPASCEHRRLEHAGDANRDGTVDVADAVYILEWRFRGGPAPRGIVVCGGGR